MSAKIVRLRPRVYTTNEELIERVREEIFASGRTYKQLAHETGVTPATIQRIASGRTRWPKPSTFFPLLAAFGLAIKLERK